MQNSHFCLYPQVNKVSLFPPHFLFLVLAQLLCSLPFPLFFLKQRAEDCVNLELWRKSKRDVINNLNLGLSFTITSIHAASVARSERLCTPTPLFLASFLWRRLLFLLLLLSAVPVSN